jgi:hypothetical protein
MVNSFVVTIVVTTNEIPQYFPRQVERTGNKERRSRAVCLLQCRADCPVIVFVVGVREAGGVEGPAQARFVQGGKFAGASEGDGAKVRE